MRAVLLWLLIVGVRCYIEILEETHCHDTEFRLTCRHLTAHLAILEATFTPNISCASENTTAPPNTEDTRHLYRQPLNRRCSGKNVCSFRLIQDHKPAESWGPGTVFVKYACMEGVNTSRFCTKDVVAKDEGFLLTPGYPRFYIGQQECKWTVSSPPGQKVQLQILDVSLRGIVAPAETNCTDLLTVTENNRTLLSTCGDEDDLIHILSEGNTLEVTVTAGSKIIFPKRGVLAHYKAIGCVHPPPPHDGYVVYKNETFGEYMCCVGYAFPDTYEKSRVLNCVNNNTWNNTLPDCTNISNSIWAMRLHSDNSTFTDVTAIIKDSDLMFDVLLPTVIICVLLVGNGVIIFVIYYLRKRKLATHLEEEEVGAIYQPNDGSERAIDV